MDKIFSTTPNKVPDSPAERADYYRTLAREIAQREEHPDPALFVSMIQQESAFDPSAVSTTGARGLGQLTSAARNELERLKLMPKMSKAEYDDPVKNLQAAARYHKHLYSVFEDLPSDARRVAALMAYNGGPTAVREFVESGKVSKFHNAKESKEYIYRVTRNTPYAGQFDLAAIDTIAPKLRAQKQATAQNVLASFAAPVEPLASTVPPLVPEVPAAPTPTSAPAPRASAASVPPLVPTGFDPAAITKDVRKQLGVDDSALELAMRLTPRADPNMKVDEFGYTQAERAQAKRLLGAIFDSV